MIDLLGEIVRCVTFLFCVTSCFRTYYKMDGFAEQMSGKLLYLREQWDRDTVEKNENPENIRIE